MVQYCTVILNIDNPVNGEFFGDTGAIFLHYVLVLWIFVDLRQNGDGVLNFVKCNNSKQTHCKNYITHHVKNDDPTICEMTSQK
jgi:hypothetical protein